MRAIAMNFGIRSPTVPNGRFGFHRIAGNTKKSLVNNLLGNSFKRCSSSVTKYPNSASEFVNTLKVFNKESFPTIPTYRIMDESGTIVNTTEDPKLDKAIVTKMYRCMVTLNTMDTVLYDSQRQGRISFYMTNYGEEATHMGSAAALELEDIVYGQYREAGVLMWRGFTLEEFVNQCYSNKYDYGKGRQMPVHYGSNKLNFHTISSPLATQIPQATGASYAQKLRPGNKNCTICYFGEGAASEGDFHAALNFAATLKTPTIFFCRNNRYAISTSSNEQFAGDGIAVRGIAYGMNVIRVDGNDVFAVYKATQTARKLAVEKNEPTLIEAMTYRIGHHSTSDDASRYRTNDEVEQWQKHTPIPRLYNYLLKKGWWSAEEDKELRTSTRKQVLEALTKAEAVPKPPIDELFTDVYDEIPLNLLEQKQELLEHISKYPQNYPIEQHEKS